MMFRWLHHILNPHCAECNHNPLVEELKEQLALARRENERLLEHIIQPKVIEKEVPIQRAQEPIKPRHIPWEVRRQMLEERDRLTAEALKKRGFTQTTEELEKEVLGEAANG